jgi:hypothetical protein
MANGRVSERLREGDYCELWRVYQVDTETPIKVFRNPASLLGSSLLRVELNALRGLVEPADQSAAR